MFAAHCLFVIRILPIHSAGVRGHINVYFFQDDSQIKIKDHHHHGMCTLYNHQNIHFPRLVSTQISDP
jgi:hypothetical protein